MADVSKWYGKALISVQDALLDEKDATVVAILCTSAYTPNQDTHEFISDLTNELTGGGYARVTLANKSLAYDATTNKAKFTADPFTFTALTSSGFRHLVIAVSTGTDSTSRLIKFTTFDVDKVPTAQDVVITPAAGGLADLVAA